MLATVKISIHVVRDNNKNKMKKARDWLQCQSPVMETRDVVNGSPMDQVGVLISIH